MANNIVASLNALKTGAYARETLLPWESAADYNELRTRFWLIWSPRENLRWASPSTLPRIVGFVKGCSERLRLATHRHAFGRMLEESGSRSWSDALKIVRKRHVDRHRHLSASRTQPAKLLSALRIGLDRSSSKNSRRRPAARRPQSNYSWRQGSGMPRWQRHRMKEMQAVNLPAGSCRLFIGLGLLVVFLHDAALISGVRPFDGGDHGGQRPAGARALLLWATVSLFPRLSVSDVDSAVCRLRRSSRSCRGARRWR
jgi:hypothetical protein